jgi:ABC-type branched-subunit amino acid transport system ATPase component
MSLTASNITVHFGGLRALHDVAVGIQPGRIVGLVGPNGAGKTTLFNCLTGVVTPQQGKVELDGEDISGMRMDRRVRRGISRTFQTPRVDPDLSVLEAVLLGFNPTLTQSFLTSFVPLASVASNENRLRQEARRLIAEFELTDDPESSAGNLSLGRLRLLEVARAIAGSPRFLLLDEPAAGVDDRDRELLAMAIRKAAASGLGVLLVEHNVGFVAELCDEMVALVNGEVAARGNPAEVVANEVIVTAYLGGQAVDAR